MYILTRDGYRIYHYTMEEKIRVKKPYIKTTKINPITKRKYIEVKKKVKK